MRAARSWRSSKNATNARDRLAGGGLPRLRIGDGKGCPKLPEGTAPRGAGFERGERLEDFRFAHVLLVADIGGPMQDRERGYAVFVGVGIFSPQAEVRHPS